MSKDLSVNKLTGLEAFLENSADIDLRDTTYIDPNTLITSYSRLQLIYGFGRALCSESKLSKIPEATVEALVKMTNLERCFIAVLDENNTLQPIARYNIELREKVSDWPVSKTLLSRVMRDAVPLLVMDTLKDNPFSSRQSMNLNQIRTVMCAPLGVKDSKIIGLIYADSRRLADSFSHADLLFLIALAHYVYLGLNTASEEIDKKITLESQPLYLSETIEEMLKVGLVGKSKALQESYLRLKKVSSKELPILIQGETGTGKELFARAIHKLHQKRAYHSFIAINLAALSEPIIESELFGHEKGAFSGATQTKIGKLELANEGTLFLDEVAEIPLKIQAKLLRVLETGEFERVGGVKTLQTNIRIVSATNKNLLDLIKKGEFREDLYYRLKGATIGINPLRERTEDIPLIIEYFLEKIYSEKKFTLKAIHQMQKYSWPGNIRQLLRLVEELDALYDNQELDLIHLPDYIINSENRLENKLENTQLTTNKFLPLNEVISQIELDYIQRALALAEGNNDRAIELLGISRAKFFDRKKAYGL
ncbi:MAG: sigma-54-dependent Fis family transcriptional regulator [Acidobacteria bacterium]|nr:sigma-54-dependent Fis family transcriptional regulator [Acidobacteriota bacterium]